jgi:hypothetical protein
MESQLTDPPAAEVFDDGDAGGLLLAMRQVLDRFDELSRRARDRAPMWQGRHNPRECLRLILGPRAWAQISASA